jgi:hypothetical protein
MPRNAKGRLERRRLGEQRIELAGTHERLKLVMASDVIRAHENLWHRYAPVGPCNHFVAALPVARNIDFSKWDSLALEQRLGRGALRTIARRIDADFLHRDSTQRLGLT